MKKKIVIIGNALLNKKYKWFFRKNHSQFVDNSDIVIRINEAKNFNKGTGRKTSILGLVNRGTPSDKFSNKVKLKKKF